jgi:hypothetical protein
MAKTLSWLAIVTTTVVLTTVVVARPGELPATPPPVRLTGSIVDAPADSQGLVVVVPPARVIEEDADEGDGPGTTEPVSQADSAQSADEPTDDDSVESADD